MKQNNTSNGEENMSEFTQAEAKKEITAYGKEQGFYMKKHKASFNGSPRYYFENRKNGRAVLKNCFFWAAYRYVIDGTVEDLLKADAYI